MKHPILLGMLAAAALLLGSCQKENLTDPPLSEPQENQTRAASFQLISEQIGIEARGRLAVNGPPEAQTIYFKVYRTEDGVRTDVSTKCYMTNLRQSEAVKYIAPTPELNKQGALSLELRLKNQADLLQNYPYGWFTADVDVYYKPNLNNDMGLTFAGTFTLLVEKTYMSDYPYNDYPPVALP